MTRRLRRGQEEAEDNITPLLDIVFIMLIFFIVTATFVDEDGIVPNLPEPSPENPDAPPPPSMLLTVQTNGFVRVDRAREIDPRSVKNTVSEFIVKDDKSVVIISAEGDADVGTTMSVLDYARDGAPGAYNRITLTTQQQGG